MIETTGVWQLSIFLFVENYGARNVTKPTRNDNENTCDLFEEIHVQTYGGFMSFCFRCVRLNDPNLG